MTTDTLRNTPTAMTTTKPIEVPQEIYDRLPNKQTVTVMDLRRAIDAALAAARQQGDADSVERVIADMRVSFIDEMVQEDILLWADRLEAIEKEEGK